MLIREQFQKMEEQSMNRRKEKPVIKDENVPTYDTQVKKGCRYVDTIRALSFEFPDGYNCLKIGLPREIRKKQRKMKERL